MIRSTATAVSAPTPPVPSLRLARLGTVLLIILPLAMWLANRSAPLVLGLAALCFLGAALADQGATVFLRRLRGMVASPIGLALGGFLLWSLASILWSHRPGASFSAWGELAIPLASGIVIAASGHFRPSRAENRALAVAVTAAAVLMMAELATGLSVRIALDIGRQVTYIFNRPVLTCLVLLPVAVAGLLAGEGTTSFDRLLGAAAVVVVAGISFDSESGAAGLGFLILALAWIAARLLPRLTLAAVALGFVATMGLAPVMGRLGDEALPASLHQRLANSHSRDRVDIWLSFGEVVRARPLIGAGFGTSPTLDRHPVALEVSPPRRQLLAVGHPHSAPLQAWAETGAVGAILLALAGVAFLLRLRRLPARDLAPRLALSASAFGVGTVAHGAWQGWWIAALALAAVWFARSLRSGNGDA
ncbi:O-antigen ligase [Hyphomicrobiales bacterium]|nr:O-antigen ligase [Hyphomicrobiales bacterium]CAH1700570.1 O-antigen ligase [Hyphomicrobiales bacterium]CAI0344418.1 O-antigen ligase [Hyphomicrobiales bacterium]